MREKKNLFLFSAVLAALCVGPVQAQDKNQAPPAPRPWGTSTAAETPASDAPATSANGSRLKVNPDAAQEETAAKTDKSNPAFRSLAFPRQTYTGYYAAVMGGANVKQSGNDFGGGNVGAMAGLKFGYTWPFDQEPIDQFMDETGGMGVRLGGSLEAEAFYLGNDLDVNNSNAQIGVDSAFFMLNGFFKGRTGNFMFYAGPGVGLAYSSFSGSTVTEDDTVDFAYQGVAGMDYMLGDGWSIFTEFKYLVINDFDIQTTGGSLHSGSFENYIVGMGLRRNF